MKKITIFGLMALACFSLRAQTFELTGIRYAGYTTNAVPAGFSILAVPFGGFDTSNFVTNNISLEALISTNGLAVNDRLIAFNEATTNYYYYSLTASGWDPLEVTELGGDSTNHVVNAPALSTITKAQGYAFWLKTTNATTAYIQGIVNTNVTEVSIAENSFTLVGNAMPTPLNLNSTSFTNANFWFTPYTNPTTGLSDEIHVITGGQYVRNIFVGGAWKKNSGSQDADQIPSGAGFWFLRRGGSQILKLK